MRVVLLSAVAGRETGQIMTNSRKRHTPEQVVRKLWWLFAVEGVVEVRGSIAG